MTLELQAPWKVFDRSRGKLRELSIMDNSGRRIASVDADVLPNWLPQVWARAKMMAASPELYARLEEAASVLRDVPGVDPDWLAMVHDALDAAELSADENPMVVYPAGSNKLPAANPSDRLPEGFRVGTRRP